MAYYEELLEKIESYINEENFKEASDLIESELKQPYIPSNTLEKLLYYKELLPKKAIKFSLTDDEIIDYLNAEEEKQLIGVECLNKKNLRDYIDICNNYLKGDGFINAKVLLIDSLIRQDIGDDIYFNNAGLEYTFIPKYIMPLEESDGYKTAIKKLNELFMKEPSMLEMSKSLVYKECLLKLPINLDEIEGEELANRVYDYIVKAFNQ